MLDVVAEIMHFKFSDLDYFQGFFNCKPDVFYPLSFELQGLDKMVILVNCKILGNSSQITQRIQSRLSTIFAAQTFFLFLPCIEHSYEILKEHVTRALSRSFSGSRFLLTSFATPQLTNALMLKLVSPFGQTALQCLSIYFQPAKQYDMSISPLCFPVSISIKVILPKWLHCYVRKK